MWGIVTAGNISTADETPGGLVTDSGEKEGELEIQDKPGLEKNYKEIYLKPHGMNKEYCKHGLLWESGTFLSQKEIRD